MLTLSILSMSQIEQQIDEDLILTEEDIISIAKSLDDIKHGRVTPYEEAVKSIGLRSVE